MADFTRFLKMTLARFIEETQIKILSEQQIKTWAFKSKQKIKKAWRIEDTRTGRVVISTCLRHRTIYEEENNRYFITHSVRSIFLAIQFAVYAGACGKAALT